MTKARSEPSELERCLDEVAAALHLSLDNRLATVDLKFQPSNDQRQWRFFLLKAGTVSWTLGGVKTEVQGPCAFGHIQFLQEGACAVFPPYGQATSATVVANALGAAITLDQFLNLDTNPVAYAQLCNAVRQLAVAGKWDPYLALYQHASPRLGAGTNMFANLKQPYLGGRQDRRLAMNGYDARVAADTGDGWPRIMTKGQKATGLHLICNGFFQPYVQLIDGGVGWSVTGARAPTVIGEFERRLPGLHHDETDKDAGPLPVTASIHVRSDPISHYYPDQIFTIQMSYEEYLECCLEDPLLEPRMTALGRYRAIEWLTLLCTSEAKKLRVAQLVLQERQRAAEAGAAFANDFLIPKPLFHAYVGGDYNGGVNVLRKLASDGAFKLIEPTAARGSLTLKERVCFRIKDPNVEMLKLVLASDGRDPKKGTPERGISKV